MSGSASSTPKFVRAWRFVRVLMHVLRGTLITLILFPRSSLATRRQHVQRWSAQLLKILNIHLEIDGALPDCPVLLVSNHISWVDIFVLDAARPLRFVSKAEVADWPLIGRLAGASETLYIERENTRAIADVVGTVTAALQDGNCVGIFPEGTTGSGEDVKRFHASFFETVRKSAAALVPATIAYTDRGGARQAAFAYINNMTLVDSLRQILACRETYVRLCLLAPIATAARSRRELAAQAHAHIAEALSRVYRNRSETARDPQAAQR